MDCTVVTAVRTADVIGVALKRFAKKGRPGLVTIVGAGVQGRSHLPVFAGCLDNAELTVLDRSPERAEAYVEWARQQPGIAAASVATDLAAGLADADVVLTAGTICPAGGSTYENAGFIMASDLCPLPSPGVPGQGMKWLLDSTSPLYVKPRPSPDLAAWLLMFAAASRETSMRRSMPTVRALGAQGGRLFAELDESEEMSAGYCRNGILSLYLTHERLEAAAADDQPMADTGEHASLLEAEEVRARVPAVRPDVAGGLLTPQDAHVDPMAVTRELARLAADRGAVVLTGTEALDFAVSGNRVSAVRTTRRVFHAGTVVLAAGVWTAPLARLLHLWLPLHRPRGTASAWPGRKVSPTTLPSTCPKAMCASHRSVTAFASQTARAQARSTCLGSARRSCQKRIAGIRQGAGRFLQGVGEAEPLHIWRGLRPLTPDGLPFVGRSSKHTNLVVATGHNMSGVLWGRITGKLVTEIVNDQPPSVDLQPLHLQRFIR